jgi:alkanesulfonate monooxygenase SsuD/methylene tetrahydromethanopterin reductase-like flavin-dependent oxidoreductase (luciferase family)
MAENTVRRAARLGYHLAGSGGADLQQFYDDELTKQGKNPAEHNICQLRSVYVAETREKAWDACEEHLYYMMSLYDKRYKEADDMEWGSAVMSAPVVPPVGKLRHTQDISFFNAPLIVGTPDDAIAEIERYTSETRCTHMSMWMHMAGMPDAKIRASMKLFAEEVMPHFRRS